MNQEQVGIRLLRQLQAESQLMDELDCLCERFSEMVEQFSDSSTGSFEIKPTDEALRQFLEQAAQVSDMRRQTLEQVNENRNEDHALSIRQFIHQIPEPMQSQLETKRRQLVARMNKVRAEVAGDSAVVFYSFDFYRRIVNGLVNCIAEEQNYDPRGKTISSESGKLLKKAC